MCWGFSGAVFHDRDAAEITCLKMTVVSNCSNFTSFDLKVKPKTALNRAEVDESNENSCNRGKTVKMTPNMLQNDII